MRQPVTPSLSDNLEINPPRVFSPPMELAVQPAASVSFAVSVPHSHSSIDLRHNFLVNSRNPNVDKPRSRAGVGASRSGPRSQSDGARALGAPSGSTVDRKGLGGSRGSGGDNRSSGGADSGGRGGGSNLAVGTSDTLAGTQQKLRKALARVKSLETTIESIQEDHKNSLLGLHQEIARLQNLCSDISYNKIVHGSVVDIEESMKSTAKDVDDITAEPSETKPSPEDPPYYVLLDQQKKKYQAFIERISADNKRKQHEIDSLRKELELVREVFAVSGLNLDLAELRAIANSKAVHGVLAAIAQSKAAKRQLPPIAKAAVPDGSTEVAAGPAEDESKNLVDGTADAAEISAAAEVSLHNRSPSDESALSGLTSPSPPPAPFGVPAHPSPRRKKVTLLSYHNSNLDYQGRASLYQKFPEDGGAAAELAQALADKSSLNATKPESGAVADRPNVANASDRSTESTHDHPVHQGALPPLRGDVHGKAVASEHRTVVVGNNTSTAARQRLSAQNTAEKLPSLLPQKENPWAKRVKGTKIVRNKLWKELNERI